MTGKPEVILSVETVRLSTVLRPRAYPFSPTLGLRLERLLEVLCVFCPLFPSHLRSLWPVYPYELGLCRASGEGEEPRALSDVRTSGLAAGD